LKVIRNFAVLKGFSVDGVMKVKLYYRMSLLLTIACQSGADFGQRKFSAKRSPVGGK
jgi:hypothetical protein